MVYPSQFHRLVIQGTLYTDVFNTTLSMVPIGGSSPVVSQSLANAVRDAIATWWPKPATVGPGDGIGITAQAKFTGIKLNRIGTDGLYEDPIAIESLVTTPVAGGVAGFPPPQLSTVVTLRCPDERAHAGKGRMYFPTNGSATALGSDGRLSVNQALAVANGAVTLFDAIDAAYATAGGNALVGVASSVGAGRFQVCTSVTVGRVVDTMRSRRNKLLEDPQVVTR